MPLQHIVVIHNLIQVLAVSLGPGKTCVKVLFLLQCCVYISKMFVREMFLCLCCLPIREVYFCICTVGSPFVEGRGSLFGEHGPGAVGRATVLSGWGVHVPGLHHVHW